MLNRIKYKLQLFLDLIQQIVHLLQESAQQREHFEMLRMEVDRLKIDRDNYANKLKQLEDQKTQYAGFVPPGHFYSPIPSLSEIETDKQRIFNTVEKTLPAIDLNEEMQTKVLRSFKPYLDEVPYSRDKSENLRYFLDNQIFSDGDAFFLYSMIRYLKPKKIIEVGSGYSSCVILDTNQLHFNDAISCTFIDPYPHNLKSHIKKEDEQRIEIIPRKVQDVDITTFSSLSENDILFIDSTHVSKVGSDVNHILFNILPYLSNGAYVFFHDIFYPFEYPESWIKDGIFWNECYMLRAFLQYNSDFEIIFCNTYLSLWQRQWIDREIPGKIKNIGAGIWLRKR